MSVELFSGLRSQVLNDRLDPGVQAGLPNNIVLRIAVISLVILVVIAASFASGYLAAFLATAAGASPQVVEIASLFGFLLVWVPVAVTSRLHPL